ncbi:MAG: hypothetical protein J6Z36_01795 [Clostridia bacterium]|nr:hypothetical protein [Clostridia bacterium]
MSEFAVITEETVDGFTFRYPTSNKLTVAYDNTPIAVSSFHLGFLSVSEAVESGIVRHEDLQLMYRLYTAKYSYLY